MASLRCGFAAFFIWIAATSLSAAHADGGVQMVSLRAHASAPERISVFSGQPVPRLASLRYGEVNGRQGPSLEHPIAWRYQRQGLPVIVVRESTDWRKILDPMGDEVWVHKRMLASRQTAMTRVDSRLCRRARAECRALAAISAGVIVEIEHCSSDWCETYVDGRKGWTRRSDLWGAELAAGDD